MAGSTTTTRLAVAATTVAVAVGSLLLARAGLKRSGTPATTRDILAALRGRLRPEHGTGDVSHLPLLRLLAGSRMAWGRSTTPIPISEEALIAKAMLARRWAEVPAPLRPAGWTEEAGETVTADSGDGDAGGVDTLRLSVIRDYLSSQRVAAVTARCVRARSCNVNEVDPLYGLTPLHVAAAAVDEATYAYLRDRGANEAATDLVGRPPRNLSFPHFVRNARAASVARGDVAAECELPVVDIDGGTKAWGEVRRLVGEGEPVLMRGALRHVLEGGQAAIDGWSADEFVAAHGEEEVTVGAVPYARIFGLAASKMRLADYYSRYVRGAQAGDDDLPLYVFEQSPEAAAPGYAALTRLVTTAFPCPGLIAHPREVGAESVHFFLGRSGSGAPAHIHADAVNAVVAGVKRWYVSPPRDSVYSRTPVAAWAAAIDKKVASFGADDDTPLRCTQRAGDVVYVPGEWGHAVVNEAENTFGWAMELLNRRDTYAHLAPRETPRTGRVKPL